MTQPGNSRCRYWCIGLPTASLAPNNESGIGGPRAATPLLLATPDMANRSVPDGSTYKDANQWEHGQAG